MRLQSHQVCIIVPPLKALIPTGLESEEFKLKSKSLVNKLKEIQQFRLERFVKRVKQQQNSLQKIKKFNLVNQRILSKLNQKNKNSVSELSDLSKIGRKFVNIQLQKMHNSKIALLKGRFQQIHQIKQLKEFKRRVQNSKNADYFSNENIRHFFLKEQQPVHHQLKKIQSHSVIDYWHMPIL